MPPNTPSQLAPAALAFVTAKFKHTHSSLSSHATDLTSLLISKGFNYNLQQIRDANSGYLLLPNSFSPVTFWISTVTPSWNHCGCFSDFEYFAVLFFTLTTPERITIIIKILLIPWTPSSSILHVRYDTAINTRYECLAYLPGTFCTKKNAQFSKPLVCPFGIYDLLNKSSLETLILWKIRYRTIVKRQRSDSFDSITDFLHCYRSTIFKTSALYPTVCLWY